MERPKINKRKITNDWQKYCPELSELRMLDIDNRVGPLIIGFYLQVLGMERFIRHYIKWKIYIAIITCYLLV